MYWAHHIRHHLAATSIKPQWLLQHEVALLYTLALARALALGPTSGGTVRVDDTLARLAPTLRVQAATLEYSRRLQP